MEKKKIVKKSNVGKIIGIGAGITALGVATYFMFGPNSKKNKKMLKGWAMKMKGEIIEKLEEAKEITEPVYHNVVDKIEARYKKFKNIDQEELKELVSDIKKHWKAISKEAKSKKKK